MKAGDYVVVVNTMQNLHVWDRRLDDDRTRAIASLRQDELAIFLAQDEDTLVLLLNSTIGWASTRYLRMVDVSSPR